MCKEYVHRWSDAARIVRSSRNLPWDYRSWHYYGVKPGRNLLANYRHNSGDMLFHYVPPVASGKPFKQWTIPMSFDNPRFTTYPPESVLVVAEKGKE